jgi:hypothetical protein
MMDGIYQGGNQNNRNRQQAVVRDQGPCHHRYRFGGYGRSDRTPGLTVTLKTV